MRIQVNLSDEMVEKLNDYSKRLGVPRSSLCAVWLGQVMAGLDTAMNAIESGVAQYGDAVEIQVSSDLSVDKEVQE